MPLGLYISVPFCRSKCSYCNFASDVFSPQRFAAYVERVCADMARAAQTAEAVGGSFEARADTVYLGGGTPSVLAPAQLEQLFRAVLVITTKPVRPRKGQLQGTPFVAKVIASDRFFGTRRVWRDQTPIDVSDPCRTIIDILNEPGLGGGIRHVAQVLQAYFRSEYRDDRRLLEYGRKLGNRTVFKRLGFLVERLGIDAPALVSECRARLTAGYSRLDPTGPKKGKLVRRWNLLINIEVPSSR